MSMINPLNLESLKQQWSSAKPFPHIVIENFLDRSAVEAAAGAYPTFDQALKQGFAFNAVNEQKKVQVTESEKFPEAVRKVSEALASQEFLSQLEVVTGIPRLLADDKLSGGGMHLTGSGGRLDVHVDFNILEGHNYHRRLNILVYLNPTWKEEWGGQIELWDRDVKTCHLSCAPALNRCLIFETSEISFHGVRPITAPADMVRQSFAAYYYTREAPAHWDGKAHSTIFRARPDEKLRQYISMPAEKLSRELIEKLRRTKKTVKNLIGLK
jgi:Rps23 Pro-64 3,4-dihydroxylase Tpa1-like proline 4-hydroxylase